MEIVLFVVLAAAVVVLYIRFARLSQDVSDISDETIEARHKLAQHSRILSGRELPQRPESGTRNPGAARYGQPRQPEEYMHPVDVFMSERDRDEEPKNRKSRRGRRDKPVIPFGVDRTERERAAYQAAALVEGGQGRSADLNEPGRMGVQGMAYPQMQGGMQPSRGQQAYPQQQAALRPVDRQVPQQRQVQGRYATYNQDVDPRRQIPQIQQRGQQQGRMQRPANMQSIPDPRMGQQRAVQQPQSMQPGRGPQRAVSETRESFEELNRTMREKAAVSAVWAAEEERRLAEKQARQAASARRAQEREHAQVRRQAERIVQEHRRQMEGNRSASDTVRF